MFSLNSVLRISELLFLNTLRYVGKGLPGLVRYCLINQSPNHPFKSRES